jgi:pilus assembly protein CpaB
MKSKTFVMMFVAIGCGLVAAYLTARITAKGPAQNMVTILVAREKIKAGDVIKEPEKLFTEMKYPEGTTPGAVATFETLKNKMVSKTVQPGQWVTQDDLTTNFGIELPKGFYAMAVKVTAETGAGGFILPKSKVNVLATIKDRSGQGKSRVVTVLQDVLVLAVDQTSVRPDDKLAVGQLSTATLAVKPTEAQRLTLAQSLGELRLVLRSPDDDTRVSLAPLDRLDWDGTGDGFDTEERLTGEFKLAVAKQDLQIGHVIDNPEREFEIKSFPVAPEKAIAADKLAELKGKTVKHTIFKDVVATAKHFEGGAIPGTAVAHEPQVKKHVMFIQNGGGAPQRIEFLDNIAEGNPDARTAPAPRTATKPAGGPVPGTKPAPEPTPAPEAKPAAETTPTGDAPPAK